MRNSKDKSWPPNLLPREKTIIKNAGFDFERMHLESLVSELPPEERDALMLL